MMRVVVLFLIGFSVGISYRMAYQMGAADMKECFTLGSMQTDCIKAVQGD